MNNDTFIIKANNIHNYKYDYSLVNYINVQTKIKIICPKHSVFEQTPNSHLSNHGCPMCYGTKKYSNEEFIKKSKSIHGNKYDYSLVNYINSHKKVKIICYKHGVFEKEPVDHYKEGCPKCKRRYSKDDFVKKSNKIHNNKYDYSSSDYIDTETKINIICHEHGIFKQKPSVHSSGGGCQKCANKEHGKHNSLNKNIFIEKSNTKHKNKYDYSLINYINGNTKVKIICKKHGVFEQQASVHINGCGCPLCQISKGEEKVKLFLDTNEIIYKKEHRFKGCRYKQPLKFDFYLPDYNMCIEYDGEQHFKKWHKGDTDENLNVRKKRDEIKNDYCKNNNINLLRIKYTQFKKIDTILSEKLKNKQLKYGLMSAL